MRVNTVLIRLASEIFHSVSYIMEELNATVTESETSTFSSVRGSLYSVTVFVSIVLVLYRLLYVSKATAEVRQKVTV